MKEVKLFRLLKSLTQKEYNELGDFVNSPAFCKNENVSRLYDFFESTMIADRSETKLRKEIWRYVFGSEEFSEAAYWKLTSAFAKVIDDYLVFKEFLKDNFYRKNLLLEVYRTRNIHKQFETLSREIEKSFENDYGKGLNYYLNQTHYYFQKISYLGDVNREKLDADIEALFENLRMFFVLTNITSAGIISNLSKEYTVQLEEKIWLFGETLEYLRQYEDEFRRKYPVIYIFFKLVECRLDPSDESHYYAVKKYVKNDTGSFSENLLRHILVNLFDYAVTKLKDSRTAFLNEMIFIDEIMERNHVSLFGESIIPESFNIVVEHSVNSGKIEWAKEFVRKYSKYLSEEFRETSVSLAKARIDFEERNFVESMKNLLSVDNLNPYFYLSHKALNLQILFETGDHESSETVIETLRKYLKRRKDIAPGMREQYQEFAENYSRLRHAYLKDSHGAVELLSKFKAGKNLLHGKWLKKTAEEIADRKISLVRLRSGT